MSSLPKFGQGSRSQRRSRRFTLGVGAFFTAIIIALIIYALIA
jgi:hypothetical protein